VKTNNIYITDHAKAKCIERFNISTKKTTHIRRVENIILEIVGCGVELKPKINVVKLINNNYKDARYFMFRNKIAVLDELRVVTVYEYIKDNFTDIPMLQEGSK